MSHKEYFIVSWREPILKHIQGEHGRYEVILIFPMICGVALLYPILHHIQCYVTLYTFVYRSAG